MSSNERVAALKQIIGGMIFAANRPLPVKEIRQCLKAVAENKSDIGGVFAEVREKDILAIIEELRRNLQRMECGFSIAEVTGGFRLQSDAVCGPWLKQLLDVGRPNRLSQPALETLAIIAYRQPIPKSEIEAVRGVGADHVIRLLMEMQLVRITGRSELPGRPFLYGTTTTFLEHFGLRTIADLSDVEPALSAEIGALRKQEKKQASLQTVEEQPELLPENETDENSRPSDDRERVGM